jgi:hypothetical protein
MMARYSVEIRTEYLPNTSLKRYRFSSLFGKKYFGQLYNCQLLNKYFASRVRHKFIF